MIEYLRRHSTPPSDLLGIIGYVRGRWRMKLAVRGAVRVLAIAVVAGFFGYGLSVALYIVALRDLGAARTGAYFSTAPFLGAVVSVAVLGENVTWALLSAGAFVGLGVWLHVTERHEHEHIHDPMAHAHPHGEVGSAPVPRSRRAVRRTLPR